jgi:AAA family ATP:ADP antiporter
MLELGPYVLMLVSAALLVVALGVTFLVHHRERTRGKESADEHHDEPLRGANGFSMVVDDHYLLAIGVLALVINCVNTNGEYIFDRTLLATAEARAVAEGLQVGQYIESVKSTYFLWVNIIGSALQLFMVSRVIKYVGVQRALVVMPLVSLAGYCGLLVLPVLLLTLVVKIGENGLDYSLQNTARNALWLAVPREAKYKAKQITDTVMVRLGDVGSAIVVWAGTRMSFGTRAFVGVNVLLAVAWLGVVVYLGKARAARG